jgi:hypothetical protein
MNCGEYKQYTTKTRILVVSNVTIQLATPLIGPNVLFG